MHRKSWIKWKPYWRLLGFDLRGLWRTFRREWRERPLTLTFEMIGTGASMIAAVVLSVKLTGLIPVYLLWLTGSICLTVSTWQRQNSSLLLLMAFYTIMNLIGLWNWL